MVAIKAMKVLSQGSQSGQFRPYHRVSQGKAKFRVLFVIPGRTKRGPGIQSYLHEPILLSKSVVSVSLEGIINLVWVRKYHNSLPGTKKSPNDPSGLGALDGPVFRC